MDIGLKPGVTELAIMKAAQVGGSEGMRNVQACLSDQTPDPIGIALPDRVKGRHIIGNRIIPLYAETPTLASKFTGKAADITKGQLVFVDHIVFLMWAGSAAAMSSDPMRFVFLDEVNKFKDWVGREADPVSLVRKRTVTYGSRARLWAISTPTTKDGRITELFDGSTIQLYYLVPCPHCGHRQRLVFPQIKWERPEGLEGKALADYVESNDAAWYECEQCLNRIVEAHKPDMIRAGRWGTLDGTIEDAEAVERFPEGTRIGMQISAWYALWVTFAESAAEFIRAKGKLEETFAFWTQTAGLPFEQKLKRTSASAYSQKCGEATLPEGVVPRWAVRLIGTIDTQHDHFWLVIRAWGPDMRSHRVWHGKVETFADLERLCWATPWAVEGGAFAPPRCDLVMIDSGGTKLEGEEHSRTMEVYTWCQRTRALPIKGYAGKRGELRFWDQEGFIRRSGHQKPLKIKIWGIATHEFNDELQHAIDDDGERNEDGTLKRPPRWELNQRDDPEYNAHMAGVVKVARRKGRSLAEEWIPSTEGTRIDYRDCEVYQFAGAYFLSVNQLPSEDQVMKYRERQAEALKATRVANERRKGGSGWSVKSLGGHV